MLYRTALCSFNLYGIYYESLFHFVPKYLCKQLVNRPGKPLAEKEQRIYLLYLHFTRKSIQAGHFYTFSVSGYEYSVTVLSFEPSLLQRYFLALIKTTNFPNCLYQCNFYSRFLSLFGYTIWPGISIIRGGYLI